MSASFVNPSALFLRYPLKFRLADKPLPTHPGPLLSPMQNVWLKHSTWVHGRLTRFLQPCLLHGFLPSLVHNVLLICLPPWLPHPLTFPRLSVPSRIARQLSSVALVSGLIGRVRWPRPLARPYTPIARQDEHTKTTPPRPCRQDWATNQDGEQGKYLAKKGGWFCLSSWTSLADLDPKSHLLG